MKCGVIGTLGSGYPGALAALTNTTPDAIELQRTLRRMLVDGAQAVAMEVSSHGLAQGRVNGVAFDCALFTNLSHDHLDYHGSMEAYAEAKARLFDTPGLVAAVLNLDDVAGVQIARRLAARGVRVIGYSLSPGAIITGNGEFIVARVIDEPRVELESSWGTATASVPALERFNVANALGLLGCLVARGIQFHGAAALLGNIPPVPRRMQRVGERPLAVIDYAHTPDARENA